MSKETDDIQAVAKKKPKKKKQPTEFLSSGSTLLNLACTNNPFGAFAKGKYTYFVGDSTSGKTFLSMTCFAEALRSPEFKDYRLIYDNVEDGCLIDLEKLFNKKVANTVEPPAGTKKDPTYSTTIEEFYYNLDDVIIKAKEDEAPFIYILDSMDGLSSDAEGSKFSEHKKAYRNGKNSAGSFGDGKAKKNSEGLRQILKGIRTTGSILIVISQTRDNLSPGFNPKTRSGGHALRFYACIEMWTSLAGRIKKTVREKERNIGIHAKAQVKKNRITGELHEVIIDIYPSYGIDDIGGCIDYLIKEKWWKKKKQSIIAEEFDVTCTREKLIQHIEDNGLQRKLSIITGKCWNEIREASQMNRRKKYED